MCASGSTTTVSTGTFTEELYFRATHHHKSLTGFAGQVSKECEANGLLALTAGVHEACRLIPPLIVNDEDLDEGLAIFADAV